MLIVGCGCRGRALAAGFTFDGHTVRGTTRDPASGEAIAAAGAEPAVADPDRLDTLLPHLAGVSVMCWLMGTASGGEEAVAALHGSRLESIAAKLVDSHVRGLVYEAAGTVAPEVLTHGASVVRRVGEANRVPIEVVDRDPAEVDAWTDAMLDAVARLLA